MEYRNAEFRRGEEKMRLNRLVRRGGYVHKVHSGHLQSLHTPAARVIPPPPDPGPQFDMGTRAVSTLRRVETAVWRLLPLRRCHPSAAPGMDPRSWTQCASRAPLR